MSERRDQEAKAANEPKIIVNEYGSTIDPAVVIEEADRTVLLTDDKTVVFPKEPTINIAPKNRPRKVYGGMWGQPEIFTVALAGIAIVATLLLYLVVVAPSNREIEQNRAERDRLERELTGARAKYGDITSTESQVSKLLASVDNFELSYLPAGETGRASLYQRINGLIASYGLTNTSGPDYAPLDAAVLASNNKSEVERGREKFRSLFPGVYVTMTVEGTYQNLRRFLRDIEAGNEFVVVSSVEIAPTESERKAPAAAAGTASAIGPGSESAFGIPGIGNPNAPPARAAAAAGPRGKTRGETVSLRLEMAAYFRRPGASARPAAE